jgi:PAS domain S-box-containing protein
MNHEHAANPGTDRNSHRTDAGTERVAPAEPERLGVASDLLPLLADRSAPDLPVLPERSERLDLVLERIGAWFSEQDETGRTAYVSSSIESVIGYPPEIAMQPDRVKIHPDDMDGMRELAISVASTGTAAPHRFRLRHSDGHWVWIEVSVVGCYPKENDRFHTISFNRDVTAQVTAAAALNESEERHRIVAEMSSDMIVEVAADGRTTYLSPGGLDVLGYSEQEILAQRPFEIIHPDDRDRLVGELAVALSHDDPVHFEAFRCRRADGEWLWLESTGLKFTRADGEVRYLGVTRDVTAKRRAEDERAELEARMQRAQKLEGLGVMAGGIAHDFNNLLTPILGAASLGLADLPPDSPVRVQLQRIQRAAQRAASLTNQMLSYAGKSPLLIEPLDLSKLVSEIGELLESTISGKTRLDIRLSAELPQIAADSAQITQVILNLISNAAESLPDGSGHITVRTGEIEIDRPLSNALFADELSTGRHVFFEVADTGSGMDEGTVARIFDPFFTTKFTGRGLGLAAVAGIVRGHRGAIEIDSEKGAGTVIRVVLPAAPGVGALDTAPQPLGSTRWRGRGTVLVIDDDVAVRELVAEMLGRSGLDVLCAADGNSGIALFREYASEIRLVLLDRTMPSACGREALEGIRKIEPEARIALISGYSQERATAELDDRHLAGFLKKPFLPEQLIDLVRETLDA